MTIFSNGIDPDGGAITTLTQQKYRDKSIFSPSQNFSCFVGFSMPRSCLYWGAYSTLPDTIIHGKGPSKPPFSPAFVVDIWP